MEWYPQEDRADRFRALRDPFPHIDPEYDILPVSLLLPLEEDDDDAKTGTVLRLAVERPNLLD